jgi:hypothetical protein
MRQTLKITKKVSNLQYIGKDSGGKLFRIDSTVQVRVGQTVRTSNGRVTGVVRSEVMTIYNV